MKDYKFYAADNLGKLAKWLRFLGYDVYYKKNVSNSVIKNICQKDKRIYLTRSQNKKRLSKYRNIIVKSENVTNQLLEVHEKLSLKDDKLFSRCSVCNRFLVAAEKEKIKKLIPEKVFNKFDTFKLCRHCNKVYWQGSHFKNINDKIKEIIK